MDFDSLETYLETFPMVMGYSLPDGVFDEIEGNVIWDFPAMDEEDPRKAMIYANEHMNYLTKWLRHPLFIAYAYNAGIGFTKRLIRRRDLFRENGKYEPWLSMERIENLQANEYGKKVLANYVIYMNKLGVSLRLKDLIKVLHKPEMTDRFREQ
jgi:soluble lytic murein transglycosylase